MGAPISLSDYADALIFLRGNPSTAADVAERIGHRVETVRLLLRRMRLMQLIHIAGWTTPGSRGAHVVQLPLFALGEAEDVALPNTKRGDPTRHGAAMSAKPSPRSNLIAFAELIRKLQAEPSTRQELRDACGLHIDRMMRLVRQFHAAGLVHIAEWEQGRFGPPAPCWAWGERGDARRPRARSASPEAGIHGQSDASPHVARPRRRAVGAVYAVPLEFFPGLSAHRSAGDPMHKDIPLSPVESSNISHVGYDHDGDGSGTLAVKFNSGTVYHYEGVPKEVADGLQGAESVGAFFARHVRSKFTGKIVQH